MTVKPSIDSELHDQRIEPGFIEFIQYVDSLYPMPAPENINPVSEFTIKNVATINGLIERYPGNNIEEFDYYSSYKIILEKFLTGDISSERLNFNHKWFNAFLDHIGNLCPPQEIKTNKVVDYPGDAYTYRGNTDTSFLDSKAYFSYLRG